ncbi:hypothetical protein HanRHA438_Chr14g0633171 [Helianthus annuus]|nr:hypothetical protein HanRHA438_Chr14g0633171 [Helianthus annuus]
MSYPPSSEIKFLFHQSSAIIRDDQTSSETALNFIRDTLMGLFTARPLKEKTQDWRSSKP